MGSEMCIRDSISSGGDSGWQEKLIEFLDEKSLKVLEKRRRSFVTVPSSPLSISSVE